jgi:carboxymethylenebutenolidase
LQTTFTAFNGRQIPVDVFAPGAEGQFPIVCALHGSGGVHGTEALGIGELLASQGFCVFVPHYFAATDTQWADVTTIWREFPNWLRAVSDSLDFAEKHPRADSSQIGLIGFSLGAYLSLALGAQQRRIRAIVDFFGGLSDYFIERLTQLAPVLILHGEADRIVPVSEAYKVAQALEQRGLPYEMKLYQNAGHGFHGPEMLDAGQRTYKFLKRHLGPPARS